MKCIQKVTKCTCGPGDATQTSVIWHVDPQRPAMVFAKFINRERGLARPGHIKRKKQKVGISKKSEIVLKGFYCCILSGILPPSQVIHHIKKTQIFKTTHTTHTPVVFNISFFPLLTMKINSYKETIVY